MPWFYPSWAEKKMGVDCLIRYSGTELSAGLTPDAGIDRHKF